MNETYRYSAFVSYRHMPRDRRWAIRIMAELEAYRTPKALRHEAFPDRIGHLFRGCAHPEFAAWQRDQRRRASQERVMRALSLLPSRRRRLSVVAMKYRRRQHCRACRNAREHHGKPRPGRQCLGDYRDGRVRGRRHALQPLPRKKSRRHAV